LQEWWQQTMITDTIPEPFQQLDIPEIGVVTSISAQELQKPRRFFSMLNLLILLGIGVTLLLQLPASATWYIILVATLTSVFQMLPFWRYRQSNISATSR